MDLRRDELRNDASRQTTAGSLVRGILRIFLGALQNHPARRADFSLVRRDSRLADQDKKPRTEGLPCRGQAPATRRRARPDGAIQLRTKRKPTPSRIKFLAPPVVVISDHNFVRRARPTGPDRARVEGQRQKISRRGMASDWDQPSGEKTILSDVFSPPPPLTSGKNRPAGARTQGHFRICAHLEFDVPPRAILLFAGSAHSGSDGKAHGRIT
jgi:hypothetical protein